MVTELVREGGIVAPTGKPGGVLMFHGNLVHGSAPNITPYPRKIVYLTLNAVSNHIRKPTRPEWIAQPGFHADPAGAGRCADPVCAALPAGGGVGASAACGRRLPEPARRRPSRLAAPLLARTLPAKADWE